MSKVAVPYVGRCHMASANLANPIAFAKILEHAVSRRVSSANKVVVLTAPMAMACGVAIHIALRGR